LKKARAVLFLILFALVSSLYAQIESTDVPAAQQYVNWIQQAIDEERWDDAFAALKRAADFADVSSDISYLLALARSRFGLSRTSVVEALDTALVANYWVNYSENNALLLKAEQLIAMREYMAALAVLEKVRESAGSTMLCLAALRGIAAIPDNAQELVRFRSLLLSAFDRYPRDSRPLRIFFEYARNRAPDPLSLQPGDIDLLELALRRYPFLLETDPDLAWMAAPFLRDTDTARRLVASYRAGGLYEKLPENFRPVPSSIPIALNLGLIDDTAAIEELFFKSSPNEELVLYKETITDVYNLLRTEEGRDLLTQKLLFLSGTILSDDDGDGYRDSRTRYVSGLITVYGLDRNQNGIEDLRIQFMPNGIPASAAYPYVADYTDIFLTWERYPSVLRAEMPGEVFTFRPADFQYSPVEFIELGGSQNYRGLSYPIPLNQYLHISRRALVSFCSSLSRPSIEFDGAQEQIFLERAIPLRSVHTLNENVVSLIEFENGLPVQQYLDLDLDGRMETLRRFRRPGPDFKVQDLDGKFDYRDLVVSSQSDWTGEGRFKTGEVYLKDGSVVYSWDMDGSGTMNYSETENPKE